MSKVCCKKVVVTEQEMADRYTKIGFTASELADLVDALDLELYVINEIRELIAADRGSDLVENTEFTSSLVKLRNKCAIIHDNKMRKYAREFVEAAGGSGASFCKC